MQTVGQGAFSRHRSRHHGLALQEKGLESLVLGFVWAPGPLWHWTELCPLESEL